MSGDTCVFSTLNLTFTAAKQVQVPCDGRLEKLRDLTGTVHFGCSNVVDLLLLRGGIRVDWSNDAEASRILEMNVCLAHKQKLLSCWTSNYFGNQRNRKSNKFVCSLPQIVHDKAVRPMSHRRLNKDNTIALIEGTGRFFHVGTVVCAMHEKLILERKFGSILFQDSLARESLSDNEIQGAGMNDPFEVDNDSVFQESIIDSDSLFACPMEVPTTEDETEEEAEDDAESSEQQLTDALQTIAKKCNLNRVASDKPWNDLKPETKRKKVTAMIHLQEKLYKMCAGEEHWKEMQQECLRKIGHVNSSSRVDDILQTIDERLEETTDKRERLSLVSVLVGHFTEKEITRATGVSRYFIREAKKYALYGLDDVKKFTRVRYDLNNLKLFISFISRPEIIVNLPNPARSLTISSGEKLTMASVARLQSYRRVFEMYRSDLEARGMEECAVTGKDLKDFMMKHGLSYSTCVKIMETVLPVRRVRMQCVDSFQADALAAFDTAFAAVSELKDKGSIGVEEAGDLNRRLRVAQNYLTGYFRLHLSMSSTCSSHCIRHALSDPTSSHFQSDCDHQHEASCDQCNDILSVFSHFKSFLKEKAKSATKNKSPDRFRLNRLYEECEEAEACVFEFQKHVVRAKMSEFDRIFALDNLGDLCALLTLDFSLKLMPSGFIESQSQWFGKKGISFHITHVQFYKGGVRYHHTFGHLNDEWRQARFLSDATAICVIVDHVFQELAKNGVKRVILRSDNAGNYRNSGVILTLRETAKKYGLVLVGYLFSEPQSGKGIADQKISMPKRKLIDVVNAGGYGRNADEILTSLCTAPLLNAFSFHTIEGEQEKGVVGTISGITDLSSFNYEEDGIRVRKHNAIGDGLLIPFTRREGGSYTHKIGNEGGHLSLSPGFWGTVADKPAKIQKVNLRTEENEDEDRRELFRCTEEGCQVKYLTAKGLADHLADGVHVIKEHSDTITDAAARLFTESVETNEEAYLSMQVDSLSSSHSTTPHTQLGEGWAVRVKSRTNTLNPAVRNFVKKYFVERRKEGLRAEAKVVVQLLRNKTDPADGSYVFPLKHCLKESQAQGLISRFLKVEASKAGLKALEIDDDLETEDEDECDDTEVFVIPESGAKGRGGGKKKDQPKGTKQQSGEATGSNAKKTRKRLPAISHYSEESDREDEPVACSSKDTEEGKAKRRGRPKKTVSPLMPPVVDGPSKKNSETNDTVEAPSSSRVLRSQKTGGGKSYCEISSDEEVDDFTAMINTVHEHYDEIFSEEE